MPRSRAFWLLVSVLLASSLLVFSIYRPASEIPSSAGQRHDWDIPRLVAHLNESGLDLRAVSTQKDGPSNVIAFLTTTDKEWLDLNGLTKDPSRIDRWRGTLYCERLPSNGFEVDLDHLLGDCYIVVRPFLFFGDRELLKQVHEILARS
jgi:hypothetical protein